VPSEVWIQSKPIKDLLNEEYEKARQLKSEKIDKKDD